MPSRGRDSSTVPRAVASGSVVRQASNIMDTHVPLTDAHLPQAYLITFRCYGTWLHGDERGSTGRFHNRYGAPFIPSNRNWQRHVTRSLKRSAVELDAARRDAVEMSLRETCEIRGWLLRAINVRTNHVHTVVSAPCKPEPVIRTFKANVRPAECERPVVGRLSTARGLKAEAGAICGRNGVSSRQLITFVTGRATCYQGSMRSEMAM